MRHTPHHLIGVALTKTYGVETRRGYVHVLNEERFIFQQQSASDHLFSTASVFKPASHFLSI